MDSEHDDEDVRLEGRPDPEFVATFRWYAAVLLAGAACWGVLIGTVAFLVSEVGL